jgi:cytochrome P450
VAGATGPCRSCMPNRSDPERGWVVVTTQVEFDHHLEVYSVNPWAISRSVRETAPVAWVARYGGFWLVTGFHEVTTVLRNPHKYTSGRTEAGEGIFIPPIAGRIRANPVELDGAEHRRVRQMLTPAFSRPAVAAFRKRFLGFAEKHVQRAVAMGEFDCSADIAVPIAVDCTLAVLGIEGSSAEAIKACMYRMADSTVPDYEYQMDLLIESLIAVVRMPSVPGRDDLLSSLVTSVRTGRCTETEVIEILSTAIFGGFEAPAGAIAGSMLSLEEDQEARMSLVAKEIDLWEAVEELLRYVSPGTNIARTAAVESVLGGQNIRKGDRVLVSFVAANRDPKAFPEPDTLNLCRYHGGDDGRPAGTGAAAHVALGLGVHKCIGMWVARETLYAALSKVFEHIPTYRIDLTRMEVGVESSHVRMWNRMPAVTGR